MSYRRVICFVFLLSIAGALIGCSSGPADDEPPAAVAPRRRADGRAPGAAPCHGDDRRPGLPAGRERL